MELNCRGFTLHVCVCVHKPPLCGCTVVALCAGRKKIRSTSSQYVLGWMVRKQCQAAVYSLK